MYLLVCVCACTYVCHHVHVEIRELSGVGPLYPPCGFWGSKWVFQVGSRYRSPTGQSHQHWSISFPLGFIPHSCPAHSLSPSPSTRCLEAGSDVYEIKEMIAISKISLYLLKLFLIRFFFHTVYSPTSSQILPVSPFTYLFHTGRAMCKPLGECWPQKLVWQPPGREKKQRTEHLFESKLLRIDR